MEDDIKKLLQRNLELTEENNKILHKIRRDARIGQFFTFLYWLIIIGTTISAYYYLQPFVKVIAQNYAQIQKSLDNIKKASSGGTISPELQNLINKFSSPQ